MSRPEFSILIPVYHEQDNIGPMLRGVAAAVTGEFEVLIVYDQPSDPTLPAVAALLPTLGDFAARVRLIHNTLGRGVVCALRAGFLASRAWLGVVVTMADLSDPPRVILDLVQRLRQGDDVVAASRYMPGGSQTGGPWLKSLLSRCAGLAAYWFTGIGIHDITTNFRAYSKRLLHKVTIESRGGFELGLELTCKAHLLGMAVGEVPSTWHDRTAGQSRFRLWAWLPGYLNWYWRLYRYDLFGLSQRRHRLRRHQPQPQNYDYFGVYEEPGYGWIVQRFLLAVMILPLTTTGRVLLVRTRRPFHASNQDSNTTPYSEKNSITGGALGPEVSGYWELPGGAAEIGETVLDAAKRELREETGYETTAPAVLCATDLQPCPGMGGFRHDLVLLTDCRPAESTATTAKPDSASTNSALANSASTNIASPDSALVDEPILEVRAFARDEVRTLLQTGAIRALPTIAGLYFWLADALPTDSAPESVPTLTQNEIQPPLPVTLS